MALPIDLVLIRHGQSEGNAAKRLSKKGDNSAFTEAFRDRHTASFRLTDRGMIQAKQAGAWLRNEFWPEPGGFDRYVTSEYARTMETAGLLGLPGAEWFCDFYLAERDWGEFDLYPEDELESKFADVMRRWEAEPFFWRPPNGESFAQLCLRVDRVFQTLHRECSNKRVFMSCHGEFMRAVEVRTERMSLARFKELNSSERREDKIYNCQVMHYTRKNPDTGELSPYVSWVRMVRPTENPVWTSGWRKIERPRYSNQDLIEIVSRIPRMIE